MATLEYLAASGRLFRYDPTLECDEMPVRYTYFTPEARNWFGTTLACAKRDRSRDFTPLEEVAMLLRDFALGRPMVYSVHTRKLDPIGHHIWELKSIDARLIGWFPRKSTFVAVCGRLKKELKSNKNYNPCIMHAVALRQRLDLDEPKTITGTNHNDVL